MKLSRTVLYAIRATLQLAHEKSDAPVPCSRLAAEGKMPERFLLQVLRTLVTHDLLSSTRGVEGGYQLSRAPDGLTLLDVVEAVEGPCEAGDVGKGFPEESGERLQAAMEALTQTVRQQLSSVSIAQLLASRATPESSGAELS